MIPVHERTVFLAIRGLHSKPRQLDHWCTARRLPVMKVDGRMMEGQCKLGLKSFVR